MKTACLIVLTLLMATPVAMLLRAQQSRAGSAQAPVQSVDDGDTLKIDVDLVNLYCSVHDKKNALIPGLAQTDFTLAEDGKQQTIKYFARESDLPLTIGLLVDVSGSQQNLIEAERRAAAQFFTSVLRKKDAAFLIAFGADSELLQDLTASPRLLQEGLNRLKLNAGYSGPNSGPVPTMAGLRGTVLYDAVYVAATDMLAKEVGRKAMVLITDGEDQGSRETEKAAIEAAQKADAIIYGVLYVDRGFYGGGGGVFSRGSVPPPMNYGGEGVLKHMAEETGGRMFQVDGRNSLESIFDQIQQEMRTQYAIGYTPTNSNKDGGYRRIDLRTTSKDLKVQVRKGYYALPPSR